MNPDLDCAVANVLSQRRQGDGDGQTDRQTDRWGRWVGAVKPGQQRTRVMLSHSSHTARPDPGKDRGRRAREQGSRGEANWGRIGQAGGAGWAGVGWHSAGGQKGEVIKRRSCGVGSHSCVFVCACPTLSLMEWLVWWR